MILFLLACALIFWIFHAMLAAADAVCARWLGKRSWKVPCMHQPGCEAGWTMQGFKLLQIVSLTSFQNWQTSLA